MTSPDVVAAAVRDRQADMQAHRVGDAVTDARVVAPPTTVDAGGPTWIGTNR